MHAKSSNPEAGFDRGSWLVLAAMAGFVLLVLATTIYVLAMPGDGWLHVYNGPPNPPPLRDFVGDWPTLLAAGDQVMAVASAHVSETGFRPQEPPATWRVGGTVPYNILRDSQSLAVPVTIQQLDTAGILHAIWQAMQDSPAEWSWSLVAILVFLLRPRSPAARLFFVAAVSHSAVTKLGWASTTTALNFAPALVFYTVQFTSFFWGYLFWPSIILLALSFPVRVFPLTRWPRAVPALLYGLPLLLTIATLVFASDLPAGVVLVSEAILMFAAFGAAIVGSLRRKDDPVVRAQVLWVVLGFAASVGLVLPFYLLISAGAIALLDDRYSLLALITLVLPICLAIAITRYRLFDIEIIIRKTLVYGVLTAVLATVYLGSVLLMQALFERVVGEQSPVIIVVSTLIIAGLFSPLRSRVQAVIDRRFYRRRYDAEKTLADFANRLRVAPAQDDMQIERLTAELLQVVYETMQPQEVGLWLKAAEVGETAFRSRETDK